MFKSLSIFAVCLLLVSFTTIPAIATTYYTYTNGGSNGLWSDANTWTTDPSGVSLTGSGVPGNNDMFIF